VRTFLLRRLIPVVPLLLGVSAITFLLIQLAPGDFGAEWSENPHVSEASIASMRQRFGLDRPWTVQYALYVRNVFLKLDFGESFSQHRPVFAVLQDGVLHSLLLAAAAALVTWGLAIPLGVLAARNRNRPVDRTLSGFAFLTLSIPEVLSGLLLVLLAARTGWFPIDGMRSPHWDQLDPVRRVLDILHHLALPAIAVGLVPLASRMRQMRGSMLDVLNLDYVTTARAKGLDENAVVFRHALRNALNPLITLFGYTLGSLLSGSLVAEVIFSWPGLGRITYDALLRQDPYLVMGAVLMASAVLIGGNLIADVLQVVADPRLRDA
jgi:peptide/nickel transport system permease protein